MDVKILLTRGGENFWNKAKDYNQEIWDQVQECLVDSKKRLEEENSSEDSKDEGTIQIHDASEEWQTWNRLGDPVLHIDLRDWADAMVIAPLSAHSLAKLANGLCDDTLSCVVRAWDFGHGTRAGKPLLVAPAMNTAMWQHPLTKQQLDTLQGFWNANNSLAGLAQGVRVVAPQVKTLACGEVGNGAMASVDAILGDVEEAMKAAHPDLVGSATTL